MAVRNIIHIDEDLCTGCGKCIIGCAEGALELVDGKARLVAEKYCDGLGACLGECPTGALTVTRREADEFDEKAVETLLGTDEHASRVRAAESAGMGGEPATLAPFGAPAAKPGGMTPCQMANMPKTGAAEGTNLAHWPVQIRLVPPDAPFLQDAHLLLAADCVAVAFPQFHSKMLKGRVVMMGCPKFDDTGLYTERLAEVFRTNRLRSVTVARMEVPCCAGMTAVVKEALKRSGATVPANTVIISRDGESARQGTHPHPAKGGRIMKKIALFEENGFKNATFSLFAAHDSPNFKILNFNFKAGQELPVHSHDIDGELCIAVLEGRGEFTGGEAPVPAGPGDLLVADIAEPHGVRAITDMRILVVIAPPI